MPALDEPVSPTASQGRLEEFHQVAGSFWPGAGRVQLPSTTLDGADDLLLVPSARSPRLLVPANRPRAAASAVLARGGSRAPRARLQRLALAAVLGAGLGRRVFGGVHIGAGTSQTLPEYLGEVLGEPILISMALTTPRANRKPVLHVLDGRGRTIAYVKVGVNELTRALVHREAIALSRLAALELQSLVVPQVLHHGQWNELELLILSPLATRSASTPDARLLDQAMRELAETEVERTAIPSARAGQRSMSELDRSTREALVRLQGELRDLPAAASLRQGSWHGDWTPWNCGASGPRLLVWDWERCASPVPVGFDALHYDLQRSVVSGQANHRAAARECVDGAAERLGPWGVEAAPATLTAGLYLCEIGLRYLDDDQRSAGGFGAAVEDWLLPAVSLALASAAG